LHHDAPRRAYSRPAEVVEKVCQYLLVFTLSTADKYAPTHPRESFHFDISIPRYLFTFAFNLVISQTHRGLWKCLEERRK
jgi:hypothetical protein